MGGDPWQRLPAHVAEGGPGVRAGVPVVHPGEVLHVELASLEGDASPVSALATFLPQKGPKKETHLVGFPLLDGPQRSDPVLHFLPALRAQH